LFFVEPAGALFVQVTHIPCNAEPKYVVNEGVIDADIFKLIY
jgi:hypothetical protein